MRTELFTFNPATLQLAIKFSKAQRGLYHLMFHNCFNYKAHGYSDRVAVDLTVAEQHAELAHSCALGFYRREERPFLSVGRRHSETSAVPLRFFPLRTVCHRLDQHAVQIRV